MTIFIVAVFLAKCQYNFSDAGLQRFISKTVILEWFATPCFANELCIHKICLWWTHTILNKLWWWNSADSAKSTNFFHIVYIELHNLHCYDGAPLLMPQIFKNNRGEIGAARLQETAIYSLFGVMKLLLTSEQDAYFHTNGFNCF